MKTKTTQTTIRQILTTGIKAELKARGEMLTPKELTELVEHVMGNSFLTYDAASYDMSLMNGNSLGIGTENFDKMIEMPRFFTFKFSTPPLFCEGAQRVWSLKSYKTFEELTKTLGFSSHTSILVDAENFSYTSLKHLAFWCGSEMFLWDKDVFRIDYIEVGVTGVKTEFFKNKIFMTDRLLELVHDGVLEVEVQQLIDKKPLYFTVLESIYSNTNPSNRSSKGSTIGAPQLIWVDSKNRDLYGWQQVKDDDDEEGYEDEDND